MNTSTQFFYDISNIGLYSPTLTHVVIALGISGVILIALRYALLYHIGLVVVLQELYSIASKKRILGNLILMKDIQSEMEKDIEKASLRATFQG